MEIPEVENKKVIVYDKTLGEAFQYEEAVKKTLETISVDNKKQKGIKTKNQ